MTVQGYPTAGARSTRPPASPAPARSATGPSGPHRRVRPDDALLSAALVRPVAIAVLVLLAMRIELAQGLTVGYLIVLVLAPLWLPVLRQFRGARALLGTGAVALVSGVWLTVYSASAHTGSTGQAVAVSVGLVGILGGIGFVLWCRTLLPDAQVALWFGLGLLFGVTPTSELYQSNPWRFGYSVALTVMVLAVARLTGRRWLELLAVAGFTAIAAVTDARSSFAILLFTGLLVLWQMRPGRRSRSGSAVRVVVALGVLALVVYNLGQALILDGALGAETQLRSSVQLQTSGSLILGGRPELAATAGLMLHQPMGFGAGTALNSHDVLAAKSGMAAIGYDPNNNYVDVYMFGGHIELHSVLGDMWAWFGLPGLVLAGMLALIVVAGLARSVAGGTAAAVVVYLGAKTLWALLFGPLYSSATLIIIAVGLVMLRREPRQELARNGAGIVGQ